MTIFTYEHPSLESYWRSIILFGRNVASYKFALGKSLLMFADAQKSFVSLEELAAPFSAHIAGHLKDFDKQGTSSSSKFLNACRAFNEGSISHDELISKTVSLGFNNVIDAFHVVNRGAIGTRFFDDQRGHELAGISITDNLLQLKESFQFENLDSEVDARWRLVESAWELGISRHSLEVRYDPDSELLLSDRLRRKSITSCRNALNGYQKGKCFYCFTDISLAPMSSDLADIDHFLPHTLKQFDPSTNFDGVWNLVLSCQTCNRGASGKFALIPKPRYLERLHRRNNFLIDSHHPLKETLMLQTGKSEPLRRSYLQEQYQQAISALIHQWEPEFENAPCF